MTDIYGAMPTFGGAFSADEATLTFALDGNRDDDGGLGLLTQGFSATYARQVQRIFELGPDKRQYYVVGRPEGTINIQRLAAPGPVSQGFLNKFANACNVKDNTMGISVDPGVLCFEGENVEASRYNFTFCLINNVGFSISVQQITLQEQVAMMFASMDVDS